MKNTIRIILLCCIAGFFACAPARQAAPALQAKRAPNNIIDPAGFKVPILPVALIPLKPDTVSIIGVGDIMMGTTFPDTRYLPPDSGKYLLKPVEPILQDATLTFSNLEGVVYDGEGEPKRCSNPNVCYLFKSPSYMTDHLVEAGFDVVSLANNHAGDFGDAGRKGTMDNLAERGIAYAGLLDTPFTLVKRDNILFGMVAFSPNTGTVSINDLENAIRLVRKVDSIADIVIVSFHGGAEGSKHEHVTRETEIFYGENRGNVHEFAHQMIDHGADVVFGHGPHVTRAIEVYKERFISYSLGNFCTYARFNLRGPNGIAPIIKVITDPEGKFVYGRIFATRQEGEGGPIPDPEGLVISKLRQLTREDFPESKISIDDRGVITYIRN